MATKPPEAREVLEEDTIIVHRTHDLDEARKIAHSFRWMTDEPVEDWIAKGGEQVWIRTAPVAPGGDMAYQYLPAEQGDRGAFRAVVFTTEPERHRWWNRPRVRRSIP